MNASKAMILAFGLLQVLGCSDKGDENPSTGFDDAAMQKSQFLTSAELATANTKVIDIDNLATELNALDEVYANGPNSTDDSDPTFDKCFKEGFSAKYSSSGNAIKIGFEAKPFSCLTKDGTSFEYKTMKFSLAETCEELTEAGKSLNEKTFEKVAASVNSACVFSKESRKLSELKSDIEIKFNEGEVAKVSSISLIARKASSTGGPCVQKAGLIVDCVDTSITTTKETSAGKTETALFRKVLSQKNLKQNAANDKYFSTGTASLIVGDWSGVLTYTGKDTAPTWTMKKGTESKSGTFGATTSAESELFAGLSARAENKTIQRAVVELWRSAAILTNMR